MSSQEITVQLPMTHAFNRPKLYVRECYEEYYDYIMKLLETKDYVTVTGSPGIGKTGFYIYFFQRYQKEKPNQTIVTAAFSDKRKLEECLYFEPGQPAKKSLLEEGKIENPVIAKIPGALHLYDGIPDKEPYHNKMVCFGCPNASWFSEMAQSAKHKKLFMPVWDFDELCIANRVLGHGFNESVIKERYCFVGGSARFVFLTDNGDYEEIKSEIQRKISTITSWDAIKEIAAKVLALDQMDHLLMHLIPDFKGSDYPSEFQFLWWSRQIGNLVEENIRKYNSAESLLNSLNRRFA